MSAQDAIAAYESALRTKDLGAARELLHPDAVYLFSNGAAHHGCEAVLAAFDYNFKAIEAEDYRMLNLHWLNESESCAVALFEYTWKGKIGGEPASGGGRGSIVLVNEHNEWRVLHEHLSAGSLAS